MSKSTAMNQNEKEEFLTRSQCIAKISTFDKDGTIHTVPVWYLYDDTKYVIASDAEAHHVKNIRRKRDATLLIDTVQFPTKGVRVKGSASLNEEKEKVHDLELKITNRYIGDKKKTADYVAEREKASKRVIIIISPMKESSWDFTKDSNEKEFFNDSPIYSLNTS